MRRSKPFLETNDASGGALFVRSRNRRAGFTIMDLLVSMTVIAVLLALLAPSVRLLTEAARRVKCQKSLSDIGLALTMWTDDHHGMLPTSRFTGDVFGSESPNPIMSSSIMQLAHLGGDDPHNWDALGRLLEEDYLSDPRALYCPSHSGDHHYHDYEREWALLSDEIVINYNYRLFESANAMLSRLHPTTTLVTDGMRSVHDYNHGSGNNMLKADMSVQWYSDDQQYIVSMLPLDETAPGAGVPIVATWMTMDTGAPPTPDAPQTPLNPNSNQLIGFH